MFNDTLNASWDERSRRGLTTLTSFGMQALAVGVLLVPAAAAADGPALTASALDAGQYRTASSRHSCRQNSRWCKRGCAELHFGHHFETVHAIQDGHARHRR
jgi:hypothetical protein